MSSDQQYPYGQPPYPHPQSHEEPYAQQPQAADDAAQTWQGETWDTQYQPVLRPEQPATDAPAAYGRTAWPADPAAYGQGSIGQAYGESAAGQAHGAAHASAHQAHQAPPGNAADGTAYLPPVSPRSLPLPPEAAAPGRTSGAARETPGPQSVADAGYSAPTVGGNARITDAQRARAEGRSPVIAPGMQPAGLTAVLALLLAGGAAVGPYALLVPLVLLQAVTAAGWFRLNGMWPARQGIALAFLGGVAADAALLASGEGNAAVAIIGALGVWVLLTLVLQLRSRAGADERMYGLMATVSSAAFAILATGHLAAVDDAVVVAALAVAVATLARALPLRGIGSVVLSLVAAAGAGIAAGQVAGMGADGALLGIAAGGCALIGLRVASYDYPSRFVHMTAGVALPLTAAAPAVYLIGRALA
ncbi:hypothetical protein [Streptomyces peucetius]|uniref:Peptidase C83 domain-containing protein n=1 Tax=Streptomyces peucetius TaxID=1950 RepID=A0ABY6I7N3_STRPE|nr:hypothetical protein [Streptomyces peucetius]UYQ62999.1 hypothetical protein OGH68_16895 [Streptomyces peucetius]